MLGSQWSAMTLIDSDRTKRLPPFPRSPLVSSIGSTGRFLTVCPFHAPRARAARPPPRLPARSPNGRSTTPDSDRHTSDHTATHPLPYGLNFVSAELDTSFAHGQSVIIGVGVRGGPSAFPPGPRSLPGGVVRLAQPGSPPRLDQADKWHRQRDQAQVVGQRGRHFARPCCQTGRKRATARRGCFRSGGMDLDTAMGDTPATVSVSGRVC